MGRRKFCESTTAAIWLALFSVALAQELTDVVYEEWSFYADNGTECDELGTQIFERYGATNHGVADFSCEHGHISFSGAISLPIEIHSAVRLFVADGRTSGCEVSATVSGSAIWDGSVDGLDAAPLPEEARDPDNPAFVVSTGAGKFNPGSTLRLEATGACRVKLFGYRLLGFLEEFCLDNTLSRFEPNETCCELFGPCSNGEGQCMSDQHDQCLGEDAMCGQSNCREMWRLPGDHDGPENGFNCCTDMQTQLEAFVDDDFAEPILIDMGLQLRSAGTGQWSEILYTSEWQNSTRLTWTYSNIPLLFADFDAWNVVASFRHGSPRICPHRIVVSTRTLERNFVTFLTWDHDDDYLTSGACYYLQMPLDDSFAPPHEFYAQTFYWNDIDECRSKPCGNLNGQPCIDRLDAYECLVTVYDDDTSTRGTPADFDAIAHPQAQLDFFYYEEMVDFTDSTECTGTARVLSNETMPTTCLNALPQDFLFTSDEPWHRLSAPNTNSVGVTHGLCTAGDHVIRLRDPDSPFSRVAPFTSKLNDETTFNNGFRFTGYFANDAGPSQMVMTIVTRNAETGAELEFSASRFQTTSVTKSFTYAFRLDPGDDSHIVEFRIHNERAHRIFCYSQMDVFRAVPTKPVVNEVRQGWLVSEYRCHAELHGQLPHIRSYDDLLRIIDVLDDANVDQAYLGARAVFPDGEPLKWRDGSVVESYGGSEIQYEDFPDEVCCLVANLPPGGAAANQAPNPAVEYYELEECWRSRRSVCQVESVAALPTLMPSLAPTEGPRDLYYSPAPVPEPPRQFSPIDDSSVGRPTSIFSTILLLITTCLFANLAATNFA